MCPCPGVAARTSKSSGHLRPDDFRYYRKHTVNAASTHFTSEIRVVGRAYQRPLSGSYGYAGKGNHFACFIVPTRRLSPAISAEIREI